MSQFPPKAPAWSRGPGGPQQLNPNLFPGQVGLAHQFATMPQAAMQLGASLGGLAGAQGVLPVNAAAFSQPSAFSQISLQQAAQQQAVVAVAGRAQSQAAVVAMQQQQQQQQQQQKNQRAFVGVVTKMQDNYGFVDDDVFFQINVVRGAMPRIGDRVMVEANYNPNMPFKWNAFRIQLLPHQEPSQQQVPSSGTTRQRESDRWGPPTNHNASNEYRSRERSPAQNIPRRRDRSPPSQRSRRSPSPKRQGSVMSQSSLKRDRSPRPRSPTKDRDSMDSRSPPRRRQRIVPRYAVQVPKIASDRNDASLFELRRRYPNMYTPSDFFHVRFSWLDTFPLDRPLVVDTASSFYVLHKDVDQFETITAPLDPPDADHRFSAKVMLLSTPSLGEFYRKSYGLNEDGSVNEEADPMAANRLISFLVGVRGKNEVLAIGGPWSPSLDGADPANDPRVLIRTAIRNTLTLTGVDLSKCTQWYKVLELRYNRVDKERVDCVTLFLPDVWSAGPTKPEFERLQTRLKLQLDGKLAAVDTPPDTPSQASAVVVPSQQQEETEEMEDEDCQLVAAERTHWSKLDVKALKVVELRQELGARSLDKKGIKSVLIIRLQDALNEEENTDNLTQSSIALASKIADSEETVKQKEPVVEPETKKLDEKELQKQQERKEKENKEHKASLERHFTLPKDAQPGLFVFPHKTAKGGKFDCKVMSLHSLLDYRQDENKEHSFEVSLFAEAFSEIITRNNAFGLYQALLGAADKETERKMKANEEMKMKAEEQGESENDGKQTDELMDTNEEQAVASSEDKKDQNDIQADEKKRKKEESEMTKEELKNTKALIREPAMFASFAYFDTNLCGYLLERDVEEILHSLALQLTRAQVQRLIKKVVSRDHLNYRRLTDVLVSKETGEILSIPCRIPIPSISTLALGNRHLVDDHQSTIDVRHSSGQHSLPDVTDSPTVLFQGSILDVQQNLSSLRRLETDQKTMEQRNCILDKDLKSSKDARDLLEKKKRRLEDDVDKYKKRLHDAEKCLKNSQDDTVQLKTAMQECKKMGDKIAYLVDKVMPPLNKDKKQSSGSTTPKKDSVQKKPDDPAASTPKTDELPYKEDSNSSVSIETAICNEEIPNSEEIKPETSST